MIKFRGHHLICLHFFKGEGYSQEFIQGLGDLVGRAEQGETIEVADGADDVCRLCPHLAGDQCMHKEDADTGIRDLDRQAVSYLGVSTGKKVVWREIKDRVNMAPSEWFSAFCRDCEWEKVCHRT